MPIRRLSGIAAAASEPDNGGDHSGGGSPGYVDDVFSTYLYEGNSFRTTISNGIDLDGKGGLVWIKARDAAKDQALFDTERGLTNPPRLRTNSTDGNITEPDGLNSFNSDGFTVGASALINKTGDNLVSWTFRKAPKFFDVVTYTGDNTALTIPHNLGCEPGMIIIKRLDDPSDWYVYHNGFTFPNWCALNSMDPQDTPKEEGLSAPPTADSFTVSPGASVSGANNDYVAYVFAHDDSEEGMIQCGSYTGNGADIDIDLGWEPQWLLLRAANRTDAWKMYDSMRGVFTDSDDRVLEANTAGVEQDYVDRVAFTSSGFKPKPSENISGGEYIYMAIRKPDNT